MKYENVNIEWGYYDGYWMMREYYDIRIWMKYGNVNIECGYYDGYLKVIYYDGYWMMREYYVAYRK